MVKGFFSYLYLVLDIYSRKLVGWQVFEEKSSALAADLMVDICCWENIQRDQVTLHSDNGSPMKGATLLATLAAERNQLLMVTGLTSNTQKSVFKTTAYSGEREHSIRPS